MANSNWNILGHIEIQEQNLPRRTLHTTNGVPFPPFKRLEIATYPEDTGFYLFHICSDGQVADTHHETLKDAFHQAEYEFGVKEIDWIMR